MGNIATKTTREDVDAIIYKYMVELHGEDKALDINYEFINEALDDMEEL